LLFAIICLIRNELNNIDNLNPAAYNQVLDILHEFTATEERQRVLATDLGGVSAQFTGPDGKGYWIFTFVNLLTKTSLDF
jgi:hypothetical protein